MENLNFGSGSALLGQGSGDAISEAMARRNMGQAGVTAQQTPASAGFDPSIQVPPAPQSPAPMAPAAPVSTPAPATGGLPSESMEATTIIKALTERLKSDSKIKESQLSGGF